MLGLYLVQSRLDADRWLVRMLGLDLVQSRLDADRCHGCRPCVSTQQINSDSSGKKRSYADVNVAISEGECKGECKSGRGSKPTPFSSRASTCESKRPTVPVASAQTLTPSLPLPRGMDPVTSSLGVSHVTSGSPGDVGDGGGAGGVGGAGLGLGGGFPARYQYPAFTPAAMTPQPYSTKPSILVPVGVVMLTAMVPFQYGSSVPVVIK
jgi:hypothetical protein